MQKEILSLIEQSTESALDAARKVGALNQRTFDKLFQQQADLAAFYMDASARSMEMLTKAKGFQDLMAGQMSLMRECGERCVSASREGIAFATEAAGEYNALAQEGMKQAQEQMAKAVSFKIA